MKVNSLESLDSCMPYPVRVNPFLEELRKESESWARKLGMISGGKGNPEDQVLWDLQQFHSMATDDLAAFIFPDASAGDLALLHQHMIWHFTWDDYFAKVYKLPRDQDGARAFTDRLHRFLPVESGQRVPEPVNVVERSMLDLWPRLTRSRSKRWRSQVAKGLRYCIEGGMQELVNMRQARILDPIEYVSFRRESFAAHSASCYVEMSTGVELPKGIRSSRPIEVITEAFMDYMGLENDIFSYQREVYEEADNNNLVKVLEDFLDVDVQQALHISINLLKSRISCLDHVVDSQLPRLMAACHLDDTERSDVAVWVEGVRSYLSGIHAWHSGALRYAGEPLRQIPVMKARG